MFARDAGSLPDGMILGLRIPNKVDHRLQGVCELLDLARIFRCELVSQPFHLPTFSGWVEKARNRVSLSPIAGASHLLVPDGKCIQRFLLLSRRKLFPFSQANSNSYCPSALFSGLHCLLSANQPAPLIVGEYVFLKIGLLASLNFLDKFKFSVALVRIGLLQHEFEVVTPPVPVRTHAGMSVDGRVLHEMNHVPMS